MGQEILKWRKKLMGTFANAFGNSSLDSVSPNYRALSLHRACSKTSRPPALHASGSKALLTALSYLKDSIS